MSNLATLIPGYGAYRKQQARRDDDRLTREFIIKRIDECKSRLDALGLQAANQGDFELPLAIEQYRNELDRARARISAAVEGYSSWFSKNLSEEALKQVSQQDESLVSVVDLLDQLVTQQPLPSQQLVENLQLLHQRIDRRSTLLKQS